MRLSPALLVLLLCGCTSWNVVALPAPADSAWQAMGRLRLTTTDGRRILADTVRRIGDSVQVAEATGPGAQLLPLGAVARVEEARIDKDRTVFLFLVPVAIAALIVLAAGSVNTGY
jgi:hypothetical protein